jgi:hypothetical protein
LIENGLPVKLIRVSIYEDQQKRRFVDVEGEHEPQFPAAGPEDGGTKVEDPTKIDGRRVRLTDLVDAGVLQPGQALIWDRPQLGKTYRASVTEQGAIHLENGGTFSAPSTAAIKAFGGGSFDGWYVWRVDSDARESLHELRVRCVRKLLEESQEGAEEQETEEPVEDGVSNGVPNEGISTATEVA